MRVAWDQWMLVSVVLVLAACGSSNGRTVDGDTPEPDGGSADLDGSVHLDGSMDADLPDATSPRDADPRDTGLDGSPDRTDGGAYGGPAPPPDTRRCGSGTITQEQLRTRCEELDPPRDIATDIETACDALVSSGARYEVWCSRDELYVWVRLQEVDDPTKVECSDSVRLPDGGIYRYSTHEFDWHSYAQPSNPVVYTPAEGVRHLNGIGGTVEWLTSGTSGGVEQPWTVTYEFETSASGDERFSNGGTGFVTFPQQKVDCDDMSISGSRRILFVAPFEWTAP